MAPIRLVQYVVASVQLNTLARLYYVINSEIIFRLSINHFTTYYGIYTEIKTLLHNTICFDQYMVIFRRLIVLYVIFRRLTVLYDKFREDICWNRFRHNRNKGISI
jgi:hypothetical protein